MAPSARAFGAGLRPWPSATISYHLCNFWHPAARCGESMDALPDAKEHQDNHYHLVDLAKTQGGGEHACSYSGIGINT